MTARAVSSEADRELVRKLAGLHVGALDDDEMESFRRCVADGFARRDYAGLGGFLGLAKVAVS